MRDPKTTKMLADVKIIREELRAISDRLVQIGIEDASHPAVRKAFLKVISLIEEGGEK